MSQGLETDYLAKALEKSSGRVATVAAALRIHPASLHRRIQQEPELQEILTRKRDLHLDNVEDRLVNLVNQDNLGAIIFTLKTLGRSRGYDQSPVIVAPQTLTIRVQDDWRRPSSVVEGVSRALPEPESSD